MGAQELLNALVRNWWEPCVGVSLKKFYGFFLVLLVTRSL